MKTTLIVIGAIYFLTGLFLAAKMSNSIFGSSDATLIVLLFFGTLGFLFVTVGIIYDKVILIERYLNLLPEKTILGRKSQDVFNQTQVNFPTNRNQFSEQHSELEQVTELDPYDYECSSCKSIITLDENELKEHSFLCPVCNQKNTF